MDLSVRTENFASDDQSWLGSAHGTSAARSITLDVAEFTANTHYPDGYIPSGQPLAVVDGLAVPYASGGSGGTNVLAGFLLSAVRVRAGATHVHGALLDHGRVITDRLPVAFTSAGATTTGQFVFVTSTSES